MDFVHIYAVLFAIIFLNTTTINAIVNLTKKPTHQEQDKNQKEIQNQKPPLKSTKTPTSSPLLPPLQAHSPLRFGR